jgi:lipopolysaccharide/colanic/teichoic acid biosynthesis glycosyltransferase
MSSLPSSRNRPTLWDVSAEELHDRLWASIGVRVVRRGRIEASLGTLPRGGVYLLVADHALVATDPLALKEQGVRDSLLFLRLAGERQSRFIERVVTGPSDEFQRFERDYRGGRRHHGKCALTTDRDLARRWRNASRPTDGWRWLRNHVQADRWSVRTAAGRVFDGADEGDSFEYMGAAINLWPRPDLAVRGLVRCGDGVWAARDAAVEGSAAVLGRAWIGRNRRLGVDATVIGPAVLWDVRSADECTAGRLVTCETGARHAEDRRDTHDAAHPDRERINVPGKRAFDIVFALFGLLFTLPFYPVIMLMIWLEDGGPFFFGHRREGRGGREFHCWKFRSMRKDADRMKAQLKAANQADGPQFYMKNDPRLTRIGAVLRKLNLDELPQFWDVLRGHMSVVGPRPSPHAENQYCPEWREARLSVRPGITGLWQVKRTRQAGSDFQEWIQYDIEYVDTASWRLDLWIIARTITCLLKKGA